MGKITLLDGAVGTSLWEIAERQGTDKVPVWRYNIEHPDYVRELAEAFRRAGSTMLLANTFGANELAVKRSSPYSADEVVTAGVKLLKEALVGTDAKALIAAGPLTQLMEPYGDLTEAEVEGIYDRLFGVGMDAGADGIMIQTFIDLDMMRVAAQAAVKYHKPVYCTLSFEQNGFTMFGNSVKDVIGTLTPLYIDGIGTNCALGPGSLLSVVKEFKENTDIPVIFKPNAGKPILSQDGTTSVAYTPEMFVREIEPALPYVDFLGGCCGCNPSYIESLNRLLSESEA